MAHNEAMTRHVTGLALAMAAAAALATACATAQAKIAPAAGPVLAPPAPPPRAVEPVELPQGTPDAEPEPGPVPVVIKPAPRPTVSRPDRNSGKATEKADQAGAAAAPPPVAPGPGSAPLQTTANVMEAERTVRALMARAAHDLDRSDARALSGDRRMQYDTARRFLQQAGDALEVKNYVFAEQLADKAATLAAALVK